MPPAAGVVLAAEVGQQQRHHHHQHQQHRDHHHAHHDKLVHPWVEMVGIKLIYKLYINSQVRCMDISISFLLSTIFMAIPLEVFMIQNNIIS